MNSLFLSTNASCSSTSGSNLFLELPFFIQGNLSGLQFHKEIKLYVWPHLAITKYTAPYLGLSFLHSLRVIIACVLQRPPHPALEDTGDPSL